MKLKTLIACLCMFFYSFGQTPALDINIEDLSHEQLLNVKKRIDESRLTMTEIELLLKSKGATESDIILFKERLKEIDEEKTLRTDSIRIRDGLTEQKIKEGDIIDNIFGRIKKEDMLQQRSKVFGHDFFNQEDISFTPNFNLPVPSNYVLGPGDELLIDVWGASEASYKETINKGGYIKLENIGPIYVSGLDLKRAKSKITSYLRKIFQGIGASSRDISKVYSEVSVVNVRSIIINIIGEVHTPGTYNLSALSTIMNALYAAGGPTENGTFRNIRLIREGQPHSSFDIYRYLTGNTHFNNTLLRDNDVIVVSPYEKQIEITGAVKREGIYEVLNNESLKDLKDYFGGFRANAYTKSLKVERFTKTQKKVVEIAEKTIKDFVFKDGDKLMVDSIIDRFENRVFIKGDVFRPGIYELRDSLQLSTLIEKAEGVKKTAYLDRGLIMRTIEDTEEFIIPFSLSSILKKETDILLQREDLVLILNQYDLKEEYKVFIEGAINSPGEYDFREDMSVKDLILLAGGTLDGAEMEKIDIYRRNQSGNIDKLSESFSVSIDGNLNTEGDILLKPHDTVIVRFKTTYKTQEYVFVEGEVNYPGKHVLKDRNYRLSDLLDACGGYTKYAYIDGAFLIRKTKTEQSTEKQVEELDDIFEDKENVVDISDELGFLRINLDLNTLIEEGENSDANILLSPGDKINIPKQLETVQVVGEVYYPIFIRYNKNYSLKNYINKAGGFSLKAKRSRIYVSYPNGGVRSVKKFLFFNFYPKILPGSEIIVPSKEDKEGLSAQETIGITTALTSLALIISNLLMNNNNR